MVSCNYRIVKILFNKYKRQQSDEKYEYKEDDFN